MLLMQQFYYFYSIVSLYVLFFSLIQNILLIQCVVEIKSPDTLNTHHPLHTLGFGSCSKQYRSQHYWKTISQFNPDAWFWMGDAVYPNCTSPHCVREAYDMISSNKDYIEFENSIPFLDGTWDDHDYGVNDGGKNYIYKDVSKNFFLNFLHIPLNSTRHQRLGVFSSHIFKLPKNSFEANNEQKLLRVILMDTRYQRDNPFIPSLAQMNIPFGNKIAALLRMLTALLGLGKEHNGDMLGSEQWQWLYDVFKQTHGPNGEIIAINILVSSIQVFTTVPVFESWGHFPKSRERLFNLLQTTKPKNLIILSGDVHLAQILGSKDCIIEVTTSGLTHSVLSDHKFFGPILTKIAMPIFSKDLSHVNTVVDNNNNNTQWKIYGYKGQRMYPNENFGLLHIQENQFSGLNVSIDIYDMIGNMKLQATKFFDNDELLKDSTYTCLQNAPPLISNTSFFVAVSLVLIFLITGIAMTAALLIACCLCIRMALHTLIRRIKLFKQYRTNSDIDESLLNSAEIGLDSQTFEATRHRKFV